MPRGWAACLCLKTQPADVRTRPGDGTVVSVGTPCGDSWDLRADSVPWDSSCPPITQAQG